VFFGLGVLVVFFVDGLVVVLGLMVLFLLFLGLVCVWFLFSFWVAWVWVF